MIGKYRVRRGWFGKAILQRFIDSPSLINGRIDVYTRDRKWVDVDFDRSPTILIEDTCK